MAFHLIHSDSHALLTSDTPLIRAADRGMIADAAEMLATVARLRVEQETLLADARAAAVAEGRIAGETAGRVAFAEAIANLVHRADADRDRREEEIAALAIAALRQMVGMLPDGELIGGIARRAVETVNSNGPLVVEVSEAMVGPVGQSLATLPGHITVALRGDADLADDQCRLTGPDGRVIADLGIQLAAVEQRWEVAHAE